MPYRIALLIDAENISYKDLPHILKEVSRQGQIVFHAVYGDWEKPNLQNWHGVATKYKFKIRHQTSAAHTKNSTDMKLMMDAMKVLYRTPIEVFCLVTNDADYVPLCDQIHESKKYVIGIGYQHAAEAFIRACDQFNFIPNGKTEVQPLSVLPTATVSNEVPEQSIPVKLSNQPKIRKLLQKAFAQAEKGTDGWTALSPFGMALSQVQSGFNTDDYGYPTLSKLLQSMPDFVELRGEANSISARLKSNSSPKKSNPNNLQKLIMEAFSQATQDKDGWATLSALGSTLRQLETNFKSNNYGHATLSKLLQSMPDFVEVRTNGTVKSARLK